MINRLRRTAAPSGNVLTNDEVKLRIRIDSDDEDTDLTALQSEVLGSIEGPYGAGLCLLTQSWKMTLDSFSGLIEIPLFPISAVTSITYTDVEGNEQTLDSDIYVEDLNSNPATLSLAYGECWPETRLEKGVVKVNFTAGYGSANDVPDDLKGAILLMIAARYEDREGTKESIAAKRIIDRYRVGAFG